MLNFISIPKAFCKDCQKYDVNLGSQSETIESGIHCNLHKVRAESVTLITKKCAEFLSLSTITHTLSLFC